MTSAASIAQFMALMSGGLNPNALKRTLTPLNGQTPGNFNAALTSQNQTLATQNALGAMIVPVSENAAAIQPVLNSDMVLQSTVTLPQSLQVNAQGQIILTQSLQESGVANLSNNDLENLITLALQTKGVSEAGIEQLRNIFGDETLFMILQDPTLNAQLDSKLAEVGIVSFGADIGQKDDEKPIIAQRSENEIDADVIGAVNDIILNYQDRIDNTITFTVDEEKNINDLIKTLIQKEAADGQDLSFELVDNATALAPNFMVLAQSETVSNTQKNNVTLSMNPVATGDQIDPFAVRPMNIFAATSAGSDVPLPQKDMDAMLQSMISKNPQSMGGESIADRLSHVLNTAPHSNTGTLNFDQMIGQFAGNDGLMMDMDAADMMPLEVSLRTAQQATSPLLSLHPAAAQAHPASHMVAASMTKSAGRTIDGEDMQTYRLQLDPPEMGRLDIQLEMVEQTGQMKAVISAEKPETLGLLQRDMHVLLKAMQDAGFENMSNQDFTFNLSQDGSFDMGGNGNGQGNDQQPLMTGELVEMELINTEMTDIIDPVTGQRSVNLLV